MYWNGYRLTALAAVATSLTFCSLPGRAVAGGYTFTQIDNPLAAFGIVDQGTHLFGLNNIGQAAGAYFDGSIWKGFLYDNGTFIPVHDSNQGPTGGIFPAGINDSTQLVGYYYDANLTWRGFSYLGGAYSALDNPIAGSAQFLGTVPVGINNTGMVVGYYRQVYDVAHGFLYSPGTSSFSTIDDPNADFSAVPGKGDGTAARGINSSGKIVGTYVDTTGVLRGFVYDGAVFTTLSDPLGVSTTPNSINDAGDIVGTYNDAGGTPHGFLYDGLTFTTIDVPGAAGGTIVWGINNTGEISGYAYANASKTITHGFFGTPLIPATAAEPGSIGLAGLGLATLLGLRRQRRRSRRCPTVPIC